MASFDEAHFPLPPLPPRRRGCGAIMLAVLLAFVVGGGAAGWVMLRHPELVRPLATSARPAPVPTTSPAEAQVATLEARLARLNLEAQAAAANAGRAEALLSALAARRAIERGRPLGPIEEQLRLHFGASQPGALAVVAGAGRNPVTISTLAASLAGLVPDTSAPTGPSGWARVRADLSNLFTIRHEPGDLATPGTRVERARSSLYRGDVEAAISEVRKLPPAPSSRNWIASAQRYAQVQAALDQLDVSALAQPAPASPALPAPARPDQPN